MLFKAIQDRPVIVKSSNKTWSTGKGNSNTLNILAMRNPWTAGVQLQQPGIQPEKMNGVGERNEAASQFSWTACLFQV